MECVWSILYLNIISIAVHQLELVSWPIASHMAGLFYLHLFALENTIEHYASYVGCVWSILYLNIISIAVHQLELVPLPMAAANWQFFGRSFQYSSVCIGKHNRTLHKLCGMCLVQFIFEYNLYCSAPVGAGAAAAGRGQLTFLWPVFLNFICSH